MSAFLERLKAKKVIPATPEDEKKDKLQAQAAALPPSDTGAAEQLKVDIFQTMNAIVVYAQIAGAGVNDYTVTIDGEGDVVTIRGERTRPSGEHFENVDKDIKDKILEECAWGKFYRQIILPAEVDAAKTEAKMKEGVLMLLLPLKTAPHDTGVRIQVKEV